MHCKPTSNYPHRSATIFSTVLNLVLGLNDLLLHYWLKLLMTGLLVTFFLNSETAMSCNQWCLFYLDKCHLWCPLLVLGPLLFIIYVNDLSTIIKYSKMNRNYLFADDVLLYAPAKTTQDCVALQRDLTAVNCWLDDWQLALNPAKQKS